MPKTKYCLLSRQIYCAPFFSFWAAQKGSKCHPPDLQQPFKLPGCSQLLPHLPPVVLGTGRWPVMPQPQHRKGPNTPWLPSNGWARQYSHSPSSQLLPHLPPAACARTHACMHALTRTHRLLGLHAVLWFYFSFLRIIQFSHWICSVRWQTGMQKEKGSFFSLIFHAIYFLILLLPHNWEKDMGLTK